MHVFFSASRTFACMFRFRCCFVVVAAAAAVFFFCSNFEGKRVSFLILELGKSSKYFGRVLRVYGI